MGTSGDAINEFGHFFVKRQLRCGDYIESQYYNPKTGAKGDRIVTEDICSICYESEDIVSAEEIRNKREIGGKNPLLVCRYCFDMKVEIPCSDGRTNIKEKKDQEQRTKKKKLDESVQSGRKKARARPCKSSGYEV